MKNGKPEIDILLAIIVDDEQPAAQALEKLVGLYCPHVKILASVGCLSDCLKVLAEDVVDIIFLDIALGSESGFDLFKKVEAVNFQVIFTTSFSEFAIKAIRVEAVDYLLKPIDPVELKSAVNRIHARKHNLIQQFVPPPPVLQGGRGVNGISVVTSAGINLLQLEDIIHVEGSGSYSTFYLLNGITLIASRNLMHYERLIGSSIFFRTHQSHLINLTHLRSYSSNESQVNLTGDKIIPVAKSKKSVLLELLRDLYRGV